MKRQIAVDDPGGKGGRMLAHAIQMVTTVVFSATAVLMTGIAVVDDFLGGLMMKIGLSQLLQVGLLVLVALVITFVAIRMLSGFFALILVLLLVLLIMHHVLPGLEIPQDDLPATLQHAAGALRS